MEYIECPDVNKKLPASNIPNHASRRKTGDNDALTPSDIGAERKLKGKKDQCFNANGNTKADDPLTGTED